VAVLGLTACGGDGGDDSDTQGGTGSIVDCFTANKTVNFAFAASNVASGQIFPNRSTTGPMTYNGQAVTGQTFSYPSEGSANTHSGYWSITSSGVTLIASVYRNGVVVPDGSFYSQNMSPSQTATDSSNNITTFVGFESVNLAGKTFINTCHFKGITNTGNIAETWFAPGYGIIKQVEATGVLQYDGNL
jgi:hypothetical protein